MTICILRHVHGKWIILVSWYTVRSYTVLYIFLLFTLLLHYLLRGVELVVSDVKFHIMMSTTFSVYTVVNILLVHA